jgi:hypothetical protein
MALLQARIIGHPHLFTRYGAGANVFSADPRFNLQTMIGNFIRPILDGIEGRRKGDLRFSKMISPCYHKQGNIDSFTNTAKPE